MDIGKLSKRITFCKYTKTKNALSKDVLTLQDYKTVWATINPIRGKEKMDAEKISAEVSHRIYCRYLPDVTQDMVIKYKDRKFEITSVINVQESNTMLEILATEKTEKAGAMIK